MKAILVNDDKTLRWDDVPTPVAGADECLVKIEYAAINRADLLQRDGDYPPPPGAPEWMGLEVAGEIVAIGEMAKEKAKWKIGDKVCALLGGGGYAEYVSVRYDMLMPVPANCTLAEASAMPEAFATAYLNLFWEGRLQGGDTLLVQGGTSGLASVMIPLAKAFGVRVLTTVRNAEKAAAIAFLNADRVVDTSREDLASVLKEELDAGHGVDVAVDCLGGEDMGECLRYLKHGARWIMIAALAGTQTTIDLKNIYVRNVRIIGSTLRSRPPEVKARLLAELVEKVWDKVAAGTIKPFIDSIFPITEAEAAQARLSQGLRIGKVVLKVEK